MKVCRHRLHFLNLRLKFVHLAAFSMLKTARPFSSSSARAHTAHRLHYGPWVIMSPVMTLIFSPVWWKSNKWSLRCAGSNPLTLLPTWIGNGRCVHTSRSWGSRCPGESKRSRWSLKAPGTNRSWKTRRSGKSSWSRSSRKSRLTYIQTQHMSMIINRTMIITVVRSCRWCARSTSIQLHWQWWWKLSNC